MRHAIHFGTLALALLAGIGIVAIDRYRNGDSASDADIAVVAAADDDVTGSIGTVGLVQRDGLLLNHEQRGWIFLGVINLPDVPDADIAPPAATVALPDEIELRELPAMVTNRIPSVKGYQFVKLEDRILVIRPADRAVVAEIPRYRLLP
jgi:hypothetical protein